MYSWAHSHFTSEAVLSFRKEIGQMLYSVYITLGKLSVLISTVVLRHGWRMLEYIKFLFLTPDWWRIQQQQIHSQITNFLLLKILICYCEWDISPVSITYSPDCDSVMSPKQVNYLMSVTKLNFYAQIVSSGQPTSLSAVFYSVWCVEQISPAEIEITTTQPLIICSCDEKTVKIVFDGWIASIGFPIILKRGQEKGTKKWTHFSF